MNVKETLAQLVRIDSVSSRSNKEIANYLTGRVQTLGARTPRFFTYVDEYGSEKQNMVVSFGPNPGDRPVELALVGHTDTVPFDAGWKDALILKEHDGKLFGRGACDTKGFIACALTALESLDIANFRKPLALVFTSDEEVGCTGAKKLVEMQALRPHYSIVGEPTSLQPIRAGKGYCLARITVQGKEGHSAYPSSGASAIFGAARLISKIEGIANRLRDQHTRNDFEPPFTTLNVGLISGGTAKNVIARECRFALEWRPVPGQKPAYVLELLDEAINEEAEDKGLGMSASREGTVTYKVTADRIDGGMATAADSRLVRFLEEASGRGSGTVSFGTEAPQMIELGSEAVIFGPGDIRVAHQTNEFVPLVDLIDCIDVLKSSIEHFCM